MERTRRADSAAPNRRRCAVQCDQHNSMTVGALRQLLSGLPDEHPVPPEAAMQAFASALHTAGCDAAVEHPIDEPTILIRRGDGRFVHIEMEGAQEYRHWDEYRTCAGSYGYVAFRSDD